MDSNKLSLPLPPLSPSALDGLKVLELGQLIAGPFAAKIASLAKRFIKLHN
jgi:crotonobetainyl-CoA:carnitine CoA-transferase CaiB-like acyl-CoA transferase